MVYRWSKTIRVLCLFAVLAVLMTGCGKSSGRSSGVNVLKIGTEGLTGNFNPYYWDNDADKCVVEQIFRNVQYRTKNNKLMNDAGNITYEYESDSRVKYTVTIRNDMYFSDGTNVTIDDLIFSYYLFADATYDGRYSDFILNDIEGLKEYYYDDPDCDSFLDGLDEKSAGYKAKLDSYIKKNYANGMDVHEISGIRRIDDYTCTILFNSRNINSVSQINTVIASKAKYGAEYVKGSAEKVKAVDSTLGCGRYYLESYDQKSGRAVLRANKYDSADPYYNELDITDLSVKGKNPVECVNSGEVDVVSFTATSSAVSSLSNENTKYFITNQPEYYGIFVSADRIQNLNARKALIACFDSYDVTDSYAGTYYTKKISPISVRYSEAPKKSAPYYTKEGYMGQVGNYYSALNAYCCGDTESLQYRVLKDYAEDLLKYGVNVTINTCTEEELPAVVSSGKADFWIVRVPDGDTCDKYEYYHTGGRCNLTGLSNKEIDYLTGEIRKSTGFSDRTEMTADLMEAVMTECIELPVYQLQTVTVFNTGSVSPESFGSMDLWDGYGYIISQLYANN